MTLTKPAWESSALCFTSLFMTISAPDTNNSIEELLEICKVIAMDLRGILPNV
jgi:hypothetical protein